MAATAAAAPCPTGGGITVVVDFGGLGGGVEVGCAPSPGTGFEALTQAGFEITQVQENSAFLCRINGMPDADAEDCADTPPADAFWAHWTADLGGDWRFSQIGAHLPVGGDLEGWSFSTGSNTAPAFAIPAPAETTTSTLPTTTTTTTITTTTTTSTSTTTSPTTTVAATSTASAAPSTTATSPTTSPTDNRQPTTVGPPTTVAPPTTVLPTAASPPTTAAPSSGPRGVVVGGLVVAILAGAGLAIARRRTE